ncbi:MAG: PAS domain-containing protein [Pseudomonadota bacterium]
MAGPYRNETRALLKLWRQFRGEKRLPNQNDIRMAELEAYLPNIFILDVEAPDRFIVKQAGAIIIAQSGGHDVTGLNILDLADPEFRERLMARVVMIFKFGYAACTHTGVLTLDGRFKRTENLLLPVENTGESFPQVYGVIYYADGRDETAMLESVFPVPQILDESFIDLGSGYAAVIDAGELPFSAFPGKKE